MARGDGRDREAAAEIDALFPIMSLGADRRIVGVHDGVVAERGDHARPVRGRKPRQRRDIEMVVMAMRDQHEVDRRQRLEGDAGIVDAFRPDEGEGRGALGPNGVAQNIQARGLNQHARMADIGNADGFFPSTRAGGRSECGLGAHSGHFSPRPLKKRKRSVGFFNGEL